MLPKLRTRPLCPKFNQAVVHMANRLLPDGFDVSASAPATYRSLVNLLDSGQKLVVYDGDTNNGIYADPQVNYCFRAWHDYCHWLGRHDFSLAGEEATWRLMSQQLLSEFGVSRETLGWCQIMEIEVVGQRKFYEKYRTFVLDQSAFFAFSHNLSHFNV